MASIFRRRADGFEHFDGDDSVELTFDVAIV